MDECSTPCYNESCHLSADLSSQGFYILCTLIKLVLPGTSRGNPAVMIMRSPLPAMPVVMMTSVACSKPSSKLRGARLLTGRTPQAKERRLRIFSDGVTATMGWRGLYLDTRKAVVPPVVKVTMAGDPT